LACCVKYVRVTAVCSTVDFLGNDLRISLLHMMWIRLRGSGSIEIETTLFSRRA
jgi:hypothetical protein